MRGSYSTCVLLLVATGLLPGITARKPEISPSGDEVIIQQGEKLKITCQGEGKLKFSTQSNVAQVKQSKYQISIDEDSGLYTFTRPRAEMRDTGWYACAEEGIEIFNDEQIVDHPDADISWIYFYVNSSEPFVNYDHGATVPAFGNRSVVIPCRPTSPDVPVKLRNYNHGRDVFTFYPHTYDANYYQIHSWSSWSPALEIPVPKNTVYDPKIGFIINNDVSSQKWKHFLCDLADGSNRTISVLQNSRYPWYLLEFGTGIPEIKQGTLVEPDEGSDLRLNCFVKSPPVGKSVHLYWKTPKEFVDKVSYNKISHVSDYEPWQTSGLELTMRNVRALHGVVFTCVMEDPSTGDIQVTNVTVWSTFDTGLRVSDSRGVELHERAVLTCYARYSWSYPTWTKIGDTKSSNFSMPDTVTEYLENEEKRTSLVFKRVSRGDNGTYECTVLGDFHIVTDRTSLFVHEAPDVQIFIAKAVGARRIHLQWTVYDGNLDLYNNHIGILEYGTITKLIDYVEQSEKGMFSYVVKRLKKRTAYQFRISSTNKMGKSHADSGLITTLERDPELFVPSVELKGTSATSITIGWSAPPEEDRDLVHYYKVRVTHGGNTNESTAQVVESNSYVLNNLETGGRYSVKVEACSNFTEHCSEWSNEPEVVVMDRDPKFIPNVSLEETNLNSIKISWSMPPTELRAGVRKYKVMAASGRNNSGPFYLSDTSNSHTFENLVPKTTYLLKVAACSEYVTQCGNWSPEIEGFTVVNFGDRSRLLMLVIGFVVAILLFPITAIWLIIRSRRERAARRRFFEATLELFRLGARDSLDPDLDMAEQAELLPYNKKWEFPRKLLKLGKELGSGAFGIVMKGEAKSLCRGEKMTIVAVKMVRATSRLEHMMALTRELKILAHLGKHVNVVNLLGACTKHISHGELLVIVEFCRFGNLHDYLRLRRADFVDQANVTTGKIAGPSSSIDCADAIDNGINAPVSNDNPETEGCTQSIHSTHTCVTVEDSACDNGSVESARKTYYEGDFTDSDLMPIGTRDLLSWAWQVSRGMNYLSSKKVLHGDLAARNILLADNNVVKICDFGLAKTLIYADGIYKKSGTGPLPIKWMSIEALGDRVFSVKSDVWSFGIVLWEFFSLAETPYPGIINENVYQKLVDGFRMERPKYAMEDIYRVMLSCWDAEPLKRPSFREIEDKIDDLLDEKSKEHYLDFDAAYAQINEELWADGSKDVLTMTPSEYLSATNESIV